MLAAPKPEELRALGLGDEVRIVAEAVGDHTEFLLPEEREHVARAVPKRQREFSTGRVLARSLLAELGAGEAALGVRADRTPAWPDGFVGSISHTDELCLAAVARGAPASGVRSLGIDVEPNVRLERELHRLVCTERELAWLKERAPAVRGFLAKLHFSVKECAYKCLFPMTGIVLDFRQAELELGDGTFVVRWQAEEVLALGFESTAGRFVVTKDWILSGAREEA